MYNIKINTLPVLQKCINKIKTSGTNSIQLSDKDYNKLMSEITKNEGLMCYLHFYDAANDLYYDYLHALIITPYNHSTTDNGKMIPIPDTDYDTQSQFFGTVGIFINTVQKIITISEI